jgi:hypothetical protein
MHRRRFLISAFILLTFFNSFVPAVSAQGLPDRLSDEAFWSMINDFSEEGGYFRSDNFVSNEMTFQYVIPELKEKTRPGGAYLGVGPDQNFTYILALEPKIAFIIDIRRQNMLQHLMYKALFELSEDRAEFVSRLFSRKRPENLDANTTTVKMFDSFSQQEPERELFLKNLAAITLRLTEDHGFALTDEDKAGIEYVMRSFFAGGLDLTYNGFGPSLGDRRMPSYSEVLEQTDQEGLNRSYMGSEANFQAIKQLEEKNLVVPLVGDFAGPKAIRTVAEYLKKHESWVATFYLSNVEQYLFQQSDDWSKFYTNVESLPIDPTSTFIRSLFNGVGGNAIPSYTRSISMLCSMDQLLRAFKAGEANTYYDVIRMSH